MIYTYCNLQQAKNELKATSTINDDLLLQYIISVSARVNMHLQHPHYYAFPYFLPYKDTRKFLMTPDDVSSTLNIFSFYSPLLEFTEVKIEDTDVTSKVQAYPKHGTPFWKLEMKKGSSWWGHCGSGGDNYYSSYVTITGVWGWHGLYANAWLAVDSIQNVGGITATATTLSVQDVDGDNGYGFSPRIAVGDYLKVGDEVMWVVDTNPTTNVVSVKRGELGTTAVAHAQNASVRVYQQHPDVVRVASRQTALLYARQGSFQTQTLDGAGVISTPVDLLSEFKAVLYRFAVR